VNHISKFFLHLNKIDQNNLCFHLLDSGANFSEPEFRFSPYNMS
jgi:hypothetical protein